MSIFILLANLNFTFDNFLFGLFQASLLWNKGLGLEWALTLPLSFLYSWEKCLFVLSRCFYFMAPTKWRKRHSLNLHCWSLSMSSSWLALTNPVGEEMFKSWAGDEFILMGLDRGDWVGVGGSDLRVWETFKPCHIYLLTLTIPILHKVKWLKFCGVWGFPSSQWIKN